MSRRDGDAVNENSCSFARKAIQKVAAALSDSDSGSESSGQVITRNRKSQRIDKDARGTKRKSDADPEQLKGGLGPKKKSSIDLSDGINPYVEKISSDAGKKNTATSSWSPPYRKFFH